MRVFQLFASTLAATFALLMVASAAYGQSLGDTARQLRQNKPAEAPKKVITNDDLLHAASPSTLSESKSESTDGANTADSAKAPADEAGKTSAAAPAKKSDPEAEQAKIDQDWKDKIDAQKQQIAGMARELDLFERENKLRAAGYYGDAGTRLRNQKSFAEEDRKYQIDIAGKRKALDDANSKLAALQEEARKAGASAKSRD